MITTAVQHRDQFIRSGLVGVLGAEPDIDVVGDASTAAELLARCAEHRPDVVLLELDVDAWDPAQLVASLRKRRRALRVVGLVEAADARAASRAAQAGVRTTVAYSHGTEDVLPAVRATPDPSTRREPSARRRPTSAALSARELDVLRLIAAGKATREVGAELGIAAKTVENHKQRIFRKLDVQNQAHAVAVAIRHGLLVPSARSGSERVGPDSVAVTDS